MSDKKLTERELSKLNADESSHKLAESTAAIAGLELLVLELRQKLLSLDIAAKRNHLAECKNTAAQCKIVVADNLKTIAKKKDLKPGWGYNPDSGEIIEN
jgi:hypothetical protein